MRAASLVLTTLALTAATLPSAQPAPSPPAAAQPAPPSFTSGAQVVLLDMVVRDGRERPVVDLQPHEIEILEDGRRCELLSLRLVQPESRGTPTGSRIAAQRGTPSSRPADVGDAGAPVAPALVLLVFDNLGVESARRARAAAERFAASPFPSGTAFAVYERADVGLRVVQTFTADRRLLRPAVARATGGSAAPREPPLGTDASLVAESLTEQAGRTLAMEGGLMSRSRRDEGPFTLGEYPAEMLSFIDTADRTRRGVGSLSALLAIVTGLREVQGRKTVVYFSEGLETTADARGLYDTAVAEANRSNVTFYAVDARGLTLSRPDRASQALLDGASVAAGRPSGFRQDNLITDAAAGNPQRNLGALAADTGGFLVANSELVGPALERVAAEVRSYYEAVYVPANPAQDGRFRRIQVKVARPGLTLRTRSGYFATPAGSPTLSARELPLIVALGAPEPRRDFEVEAGVLRFGPLADERECVVLVQVPLAGVRLTADETGARYRGHLALLTLLKDDSGAVLARLLQEAPLEGPFAEIDRRRQGHAAFRHRLQLPPGRYTLETAVQDLEGSRLSVDRRAFEVTPPRDGLALGSLALVRRVASAADGSTRDPLRVGDVAVVPALGRTTLPPASRTLDYFVGVYARPGQPVEVELTVQREGRTIARALPILPPAESDGRVPLLGSVAIDSLAPGAYALVAKAHQGASSAETETEFEIAAPLAGAEAVARVVDPELVPLLERAAHYVLDYEIAFARLAGEELYEQYVAGGAQRQTTRAEIVFTRLPGEISWGSFRDVFELNGRRLREPDSRLERLFSQDPLGADARARAVLAENARFNFGPAVRTVNLPTLPLLFLHPRNQDRFSFRRAGVGSLLGTNTVIVAFEETSRPTIVREGDGAGDLPARGRFWIDERLGTVLRTETEFAFGSAARAQLRTDYRPEARLALWLPAEMHERYEDLPGGARSVFRATTEAVARYSNFRRFSVGIEEKRATAP